MRLVVCPLDSCRDPSHRGKPGVVHTPRGLGPNRLSAVTAVNSRSHPPTVYEDDDEGDYVGEGQEGRVYPGQPPPDGTSMGSNRHL